jgi:hypothetical protein
MINLIHKKDCFITNLDLIINTIYIVLYDEYINNLK